MNFYSYFGVLWSLLFSVCVLGDIVREDNHFEAEFSNIHKGRMLRVLMVFNNLRLDKCAVKCIQHIRCKTVNYNFDKLKCELTDVDFNQNEADKLSYDWYNIGTPQRVDGGWRKWQNVTQCTVSCDGGAMNQARDCDSPEPQHGGHDCVGNGERTIECNTRPCPVNGNWGEWRNNTECNATCGGGVLNRTRNCDSPAPQHGGHDCVGNGERTVECNTHPCPVNGNWGEWRNDTECNATCGGGTLNRTRNCDSPAPQHGGDDCVGNEERTVKCNTHPCPVNGNWGEWRNDTECNATCGGGTLNRTRNCDSPAPQHGGDDCVGNGKGTVECNTHPCPVNGNWGEWRNDTECNATFGGGTLNQTRNCDSPAPQHGGDDCVGNGKGTVECNTHPCPVNGNWGEWRNDTECNATCGGGALNRTRNCDSPAPQHGGDDCVGNGERTAECNTHPCPVVNVAVKKIASQSSAWTIDGNVYGASYGNDGFIKSFSCTWKERQPWWLVDLKENFKIEYMIFRPYYSVYLTLNKKILVRTKGENESDYQTCKDLGDLQKDAVTFSCDEIQEIRYIMIILNANEDLMLGIKEFEVYAKQN